MESLTFQVQGSAEEAYQVEFRKEGAKLNAYCTCPAGEMAQACKHRIRILQGSAEGVNDSQRDLIVTVVRWLGESQLKAALADVDTAEADLERSKKELSAAKKRLAKALHQ